MGNIFDSIKSVKMFTEYLDEEDKTSDTYFYDEMINGIGIVTYLLDKKKSSFLKILKDRHPDIFKVKNIDKSMPNWTFMLYKEDISVFDMLEEFITSDLINDTNHRKEPAISGMIEGHKLGDTDIYRMINTLIDKGADLTISDGRQGYSPIIRLVAYGFLDNLKYALKKHPSLSNYRNESFGSTLLMTSVDNMSASKGNGRVDTFKWLLKEYPEQMDIPTTDGVTFMKAVENNTIATDLLKKIISQRKMGKFKDLLKFKEV